MSEIDLRDHKELQTLFPGMKKIPSGVCSIQMNNESSPWIICPRRLLYMGSKANNEVLHGVTQKKLLSKCNYPQRTLVGIWSEVKVKYEAPSSNGFNNAFDYTFDYIIVPLGRVSLESAARQTGLDRNSLEKYLNDNEHTFSYREGEIFIEDFPVGTPTIVEVMTSSTSGGNKNKRSCIPQAFEDCLLGKPHIAPGINYRQVWARMASQLIVKSQAAIGWGGKTIWVLQDLLADYITTSTALDLRKFVADHTDEVNILAFSYGNNYKMPPKSQTVSLDNSVLYAGPIKSDPKNTRPSFQDIVLASVCPPKQALLAALCKKNLANRMLV